MTLNIMHLIYFVSAAFGIALIVSPKFRQIIRVRINALLGRQLSEKDKAKDEGEQAIGKQKKALKDAVELLKTQKESVVKLTAVATTAGQELQRRKDAVDTAVKNYNDGKALQMADADLNKLALKVKEARDAVASQEANVKLAQANATAAAASLASTSAKIQKFGTQIQDNESKLALADALNTQAAVEEMTANIDSVLSEAGNANAEIDRILAEADARTKVGKDTTAEELERRRREKEAQDERDRLDGKTPTDAPKA